MDTLKPEKKFNFIQKCYLLFLPLLFLTSGCNQDANIKGQILSQVPQGILAAKITLMHVSASGTFTQSHTTASLTTTTTVTGVKNGMPVTQTYQTTITVCGAPGGTYHLSTDDPLIIQFPNDAGNFVGNYDNGVGTSGALPIQSGLSSVATYPGQFLTPEAGNQLVMIGLPANLPDGSYDLNLSFSLGSIRAIDVKPLISELVTLDGNTYYPPQVPNISSFSQMPSITIPVSATLVDIILPLDGIFADPFINYCQQSIPTLTQWAKIILVFILLSIGIVFLVRRQRV